MRYLLLLLFVFSYGNIWGQKTVKPILIAQKGQFNVRGYERELNDITEIRCLHQDKEGILWLGTLYGLYFYDGYEIKPITRLFPKAIMSYVSAITEDKDGNIWYGNSKLHFYNKKQYSLEEIDLEEGNELLITKLFFINPNTLWVTTAKNGILSIDISNKNLSSTNFPIQDKKIHDVAYLTSDILWVATDSGLWEYSLKKKVFSQVKIDFLKEDLKVRDILKDNNQIWLATNQGLLKNSNNQWKLYSFNEQVEKKQNEKIDIDNITTIQQDQDGRLWMANYYEGISLFYPKENKFFNYTPTTSSHIDIKQRNYNDMLVDKLGHTWIATSSALYRIDANNITIRRFYRELDNSLTLSTLSSEQIWEIHEDSNKNIWVGTAHYKTSGLTQYDSNWNFVANYRPSEENSKNISGREIYAILEDRQNRLWVGTGLGINLFHPKTKTFSQFYPPNPSSSALIIWNIYQTKDDKLWFASYDGLQQFDYDKREFKIYRPDSTANSLANKVWLIYEDLKSDMWIGMYPNRLYRFDRKTETFEHMKFVDAKGKQINKIIPISIFEDKNKKLWLITMGEGIFYFDRTSNRWKPFLGNIPDKKCMTAVKDKKGRVWISANKETFLFIPEKEEIIRFNGRKMLSNGANAISGTLRENGEVVFGNHGEFVTFHPDSLMMDKNVDIYLKLLHVNAGRDSSNMELKGGLYNPQHLILEKGINSFTIEFTAIHYQEKEEVRLSYYLEGYSNDTLGISPDNKRISFINVPPGHYTLIIRAKDNIGGAEATLTLPVTIKAEFYQTWWFYALLISSMVISFFSLLTAFLIKSKKNVVIDKQKKEIEILQDSLEHDLDNDVLIIQRAGKFHIKDLLKKENQNLFENLQSSLLAIANYYVFINRLSRSKSNIEVKELLDDISMNILKKYNYESIIDVKTKSNLDAKIKGERSAIRKVVVCIAELIRNTLKYAFPKEFLENNQIKPTINIKLFKEEGSVFIVYTDNGKGFSEDLSKYSNKSALRNGRGLKILKDVSYEEDFIWKNREEGGILVQLKLKIDINKKGI
ncbi:two-component regulator propeller domain-containing protein [Bernardetia sp. MNP-M8]|uniref:two-component regulator propeller domain-containing protein n=1 Tax=Bernardetia sp. MNP-M8 TaxID=3127470 RepID=UPI0030D091AC